MHERRKEGNETKKEKKISRGRYKEKMDRERIMQKMEGREGEEC